MLSIFYYTKEGIEKSGNLIPIDTLLLHYFIRFEGSNV